MQQLTEHSEKTKVKLCFTFDGFNVSNLQKQILTKKYCISDKMNIKSLTRSFKGIYQRYYDISTNKPYITAMITGGSILTVSDLTAQWLTSKFTANYKFDFRRTLALGTFGVFYYGLIARGLYSIYERAIGPGRPLLKTMVDCGVHTPFLLIPCFYFSTGFIKGQTFSEITSQLKQEWWTSSTASLAYWLPMMWFNFTYCTPQTRILFICILSWMHKSALSWYSNRNRVRMRFKEQYESQNVIDKELLQQQHAHSVQG